METDHFLDLWGGYIGIALVDIRASRAFHLRQAGAAEPTPYLGSKQWSDLKLALSAADVRSELPSARILAQTIRDELAAQMPTDDLTLLLRQLGQHVNFFPANHD